MKNIKNCTKRILAVALTLSVAASAFFGAAGVAVSALSEGSDYSIINDENTVRANASSDKALTLKGKVEAYYKDESRNYEKIDIDASTLKKLNDGDLSTQCDIANQQNKYSHPWFYDISGEDVSGWTWYLDGTTRVMRFVFPLKGISNVSDIVVAATNGDKLRIGKYAVFASADKETLFDQSAAAFYRLYDNKTEKNRFMDFNFGSGKLTGVRYAGLEIYDTDCCTAAEKEEYVINNGKYVFHPRLMEFNVYGEVTDEDVKLSESDETDMPSLGTNVGDVSGITAKMYGENGNNIASADESVINSMTDGNLSSASALVTSDGKYAFYDEEYNKKNVHFDITVPIKDGYNATKLFIHSLGGAVNTKSYEIYAADSKDALFAGTNLIKDYVNNGKKSQTFDFSSNGLNKKFVGIRITDPVTMGEEFKNNYTYLDTTPRICEIRVFGKKADNFTVAASNNADVVPAGVGDKLNTADAGVTFYDGGNETVLDNALEVAKLSNDNASDYTSFAAKPIASGDPIVFYSQTTNPKKYYTVVHTLSDISSIKAVNVISADNSKYYLGSYKIYASSSLSTLFDDNSLAAEVNTDGKRSTLVTLKEEVRAKYVAMLTDDVCKKSAISSADEAYLRVAEFSVFGTNLSKNVVKTVDSDSADSIPNLDPEKSVVVSTALVGKSAEGTEKDYTANYSTAISRLTDSTVNAEAEFWDIVYASGATNEAGGIEQIYTDGNTAYTKITHTLNGESDIEKIVVIGKPNQSKFSTSYELYIGSDLDTLYSGTPVATYNNTSRNRTQVFTVTGWQAKYVGMKITAVSYTNDKTEFSSFNKGTLYPRLWEFNVYGTPGEANTAPTTGESVPMPSEDSLVKSAKAYYFDGSSKKEVKLSSLNYLYDKSVKHEVTSNEDNVFAYDDNGTVKYYGDRYLDIVLNLNGSCKLNNVYVCNALGDLATGEYNIYYSNTESDLWNKAFSTFKNTNNDRTQNFALGGVTARYVGIRIKYPVNKDANLALKDIIARIYEFNAFGKTTEPDEPKGEDGVMPGGENLLKGRKVTAQVIDVKNNQKAPYTSSDISKLSDNDTGSCVDINSGYTWWADYSGAKPTIRKDGSIYAQITYELKAEIEMEKFYFCGSPSTSGSRTGEFYVYASDSKDTLFDAPVAKVDNTATKYRAVTVNFPQKLTGVRFVGVRIIDPITTDNYEDGTMKLDPDNKNNQNAYPRIAEIAAYGRVISEDPVVFEKVTYSSDNSALPSDVNLSGLSNLSQYFRIKGYKGEVTGTDVMREGYILTDSVTKPLFDGVTNVHKDIPYNFAEYNVPTGTVTYYNDETSASYRFFDLVYDLHQTADLSYIVIGSTKTPLCLGKYAVYIGDNADELFEGTPYAIVDNATNYQKDGELTPLNIISFDKSDKTADTAKCVGIRIYNPVSVANGDTSYENGIVDATRNNINIRISEFAVYGEYVDKNYNPYDEIEEAPKVLTDDELLNFGKTHSENLLKYDNASIYLNGKKVLSTLSDYGSLRNLLALNNKRDGKYWHVDFTTRGVTDYVFKLNKYDYTQIDGFAFQSNASDNLGYITSEYEVYVAETLDDLFYEENRVFHFDPIGNDYDVTKNQYVEFEKGKQPKGTYMAFRIIKPYYTGTEEANWTPRISFMWAFGKEAKLSTVPANIAENMPVTPSFVNGGKLTEIPESNLSANDLKYMTDTNSYKNKGTGITTYSAKNDTYGDIDTKGSSRNTMSLIYNLCGDISVDKVGITFLNNKTYGFKTLKVYGSDTLAGVESEKALLWTYNAKGTGTLSPSKSFASSKKMRYVKFLFEGTKDKVRIFNIDVIGQDNQKMKTRNLTNSMEANNVIVYKSTSGREREYYTVYEGLTGALIDGDITTYLPFDTGYVGETKYDVMIYLGDLKTISSIRLDMAKTFEKYMPKKINVYFGETDAVLNETKPDYTVTAKDLNNSAQWDKQIRPVMARYIRLELPEFNKLENYKEYLKDGSTKYRVASMLNDIRIMGTKVVGTQTDEDRKDLVTFTDKATGVSLTINRFDKNDIFDKPVKIKVTKSNATNWQMRSLQSSNMKVIGKSVYKIQLLDVYGNEVKDIDGRKVTVGFKTPSEYADGLAMVGDASDRTTISGIDTVYSRGISTCEETDWNKDGNNKFALLGITTEDDAYWDTIGELENFSDAKNVKNVVNGVIRNEDWFDSIHAFDKKGKDKVEVTSLGDEFENGVKFIATDISDTASDSEYYEFLQYADGKKIAAFYNFDLSKDGSTLSDVPMELKVKLSDYVLNNYTDLQVFGKDSSGNVVELWSELDGDIMNLQTSTSCDVVIIGTALDGSSSVGIGDGINTPQTGETAPIAVMAVLVAAAFVIGVSVKKSIHEK